MAFLYVVQHELRKKTFRNRVRLADLTEEIIQITRMPRDAVQQWCDVLANELTRPTDRSQALPVDTQLLTVFEFYASGSFQWMLGTSTGLSQPTVSRVVQQVTSAICRLAPLYISFPTRQDELLQSKLSFSGFGGFPNVIGAIGG